MTFTDQKPWVVTEADLKANWGGIGRRGFACGFCFHQFELGETVRWFYCPATAPNSFVCEKCDGADVVDRWMQFWREVAKPILERWGGD